MHQINVLAFGSKNFNTSLLELKDHFNFRLTTHDKDLELKMLENQDILFCHEDCLKDTKSLKIIDNSSKLKILAYKSDHVNSNIFSEKLNLPTSISEINFVMENLITKENFSRNSSIKIKNYTLDKNEKKLINEKKFISLTEKEVQLLELFLSIKKPINKNKILSQVWKYSEDADTHTVETHIYRLRKKIKLKFADEKFILNDKNGYIL